MVVTSHDPPFHLDIFEGKIKNPIDSEEDSCKSKTETINHDGFHVVQWLHG